MTTSIFSDVLSKGISKRFKAGEVEVRDYFRDKALSLTRKQTSPSRILNRVGAKANEINTPEVGKLIMYMYDPKHKQTLPYYDTFPMVFPISPVEKGSFLGLNMHYLPPVYRARLLDLLYDTLNNRRFDDSTKMNINYKILNNAAKFSYFRPCIKRYLVGHIKSRIVEVPAAEWDYTIFLPVSRFQKASERKVWDDSISKIMGN